jgi:hypothetical protein
MGTAAALAADLGVDPGDVDVLLEQSAGLTRQPTG